MHVNESQLRTDINLFEVKLLVKLVHLFDSGCIRCESIVACQDHIRLVWKCGAPVVERADILACGAAYEIEPNKASLSCDAFQVSRRGNTNNVLALAQVYREGVSGDRASTPRSIREGSVFMRGHDRHLATGTQLVHDFLQTAEVTSQQVQIS